MSNTLDLGALRAKRPRSLTAHTPFEQRFWARVDVTPGCWNWTGARNGDGYGVMDVSKRVALVHRLSWKIHYGFLPPVLDHLCMNKQCVNPTHLESVTLGENTRRYLATITQCPRGHGYTPENTARRRHPKHGYVYRVCRECERAKGRRRYAARMAARLVLHGAGEPTVGEGDGR